MPPPAIPARGMNVTRDVCRVYSQYGLVKTSEVSDKSCVDTRYAVLDENAIAQKPREDL